MKKNTPNPIPAPKQPRPYLKLRDEDLFHRFCGPGQCTRCGCIEVKLDQCDGLQDLSAMGENPEYPYGAGCEVCKDKPLGWRSATAPDKWVAGTTYAKSFGYEAPTFQ